VHLYVDIDEHRKPLHLTKSSELICGKSVTYVAKEYAEPAKGKGRKGGL
jgi:hypothetical protein